MDIRTFEYILYDGYKIRQYNLNVCKYDNLRYKDAPIFARCFEHYEQRLSSLRLWPPQITPSKETLCMAGFYYHFIYKCTCCYSCGLKLSSWRKKQNPLNCHITWNPFCQYLNLIQHLMTKKQKHMLQTGMEQHLNNTDLTYMKRELKLYIKSEEINNLHSSSMVDIVNISENLLCLVCYTHKREYIALPCRHFCFCLYCLYSSSFCSLCRTRVHGCIRINL